MCPPENPVIYGDHAGGLFCCGGQLDRHSGACTHGICCLLPGAKAGCQGLSRCHVVSIATVHLDLPPLGTAAIRIYEQGGVPQPPAVPNAATRNLIFNSGFERLGTAGVVDGMFAYNGGDLGASMGADSTIAHTGRRSLRVRTATVGQHLEVMTIPLSVSAQQGATYTLSVWARAEPLDLPSHSYGLNATAQLRIGFPWDG